MQKNDGIIIMDKPQGFTSFDMVAKMRGMLGTRKVGHAGTLDPMATGVLPIFVGRATKCCDLLPDQDKSYTATFELGYTTDTLDATGKLLSKQPVTAGEEQVRAVLERFRGPISQLPPMYSAISIGGKRLYDLARQGSEVERERRPVTIHSLELTAAQPQENRYTIEVNCSKGTYIRTLCADIGEALGCGATMTALRRTCAAGFSLEDALTLEQAQLLAFPVRAAQSQKDAAFSKDSHVPLPAGKILCAFQPGKVQTNAVAVHLLLLSAQMQPRQ